MNEGVPPDTAPGLNIDKIPFQHEGVSDFMNELCGGPTSEQMLSEHIDVIRDTNARRAFERLSIADAANSIVSSAPIRDDMIGLPPAQHNYLVGLIMAHGSPKGTVDLLYEELAGPVMDISLKSIFCTPDWPGPDSTGEEKLRDNVVFQLRQKAFTSGYFVMTEQPREAAKRAYRPHNQYLQREHGFTIEEALDCGDYLMSIVGALRKRAFSSADFDFADMVSEGHSADNMIQEFEETGKLKMGADGQDFQQDAQAIENMYQEIGKRKSNFSIDIGSLKDRLPEHIDSATFENFTSRMSTVVGNVDSNPDFRWPYQFNPINRTPLVESDSRWFVPCGKTMMIALMESFYYDLITLDDYGDPSGESGGEFGSIYGDYIEDWTRDSIAKLLPENRVVANPLYPTEGFPEACDILVEGEDTLFIIECKVGKIPLRLRDGDFEEIQNSLQSKVGEAYDQAINLIRDLRDGDDSELVYDGKRIDFSSYQNYQPIVVVGDQYDSLATHLVDIIIEIDDVTPYVIDVFDLQILTEYFSDLDGFQDYVEKRTELFEQRAIVSPDEIDYLGIYIQNNGEFPDMAENQFMMIEDMTHIVAQEIDYKFGY